MNNNDLSEQKVKAATFTHRLDFFWQYIAVYAIAMIIYVLLKGTISEWTVTVVLLDPLVLLLAIIIVGTAISMVFNYYKKQEVLVGKDFIIFKNRYRSIKYTQNEIIKIAFSRERNKLRSTYRVIKIKVSNRRRIIRIKPMAFWDERMLVHDMIALKKNINR